MNAGIKGVQTGWQRVKIETVLAPLEDGRTLHQGWSPQCEKEPSPSEDHWGVLKTTSIQSLRFCPEYNKALPRTLAPRPLLEVRAGDILITCAGPRIRCGISCLVEETRGRLMISGKMYRFRPTPEIMSARFLAAFLQTEQAVVAINGMKTGGSESGLNLTHERFRQLVIPVPPLPEQQRIVGVLDEAFAGLATAQAHAEKNLQNARALFESHLHSVFTQRGKGWVEKRLIDVATDFGRGKSKHRPRNEPLLYNGNFPFIQTGDIANANHWLTEYSQTYNESGLAQSKLWPRGTICIAIVGATVGESAILDFEACFPDSVIGITVDDTHAHCEYVEFLIQSFKAVLKEKGKGTARDNINLGTFENHFFPFPTLQEQRKIVATLNTLLSHTQRLAALYEQKLAALAALKKSLLHQAFSGEL